MATRRPSPRPTFELRSKHAPGVIAERTRALLRGSRRLRGLAQESRLEIAIGEDAHFWSPQLVVRLAPAEDGGTVLDARFGPDPYVWALYVLAYGMLVVLTSFAAMFGIAQWTLGQSPTALVVAPAAGVLAGLVYGASFVGQGLGSEQMYMLRATLTDLAEADSVP